MTGCTTSHFCPSHRGDQGQDGPLPVPGIPGAGDRGEPLRDVPSTATSSISRVVAAGIMTGCSSTRFCPTQPGHTPPDGEYLRACLRLAATGGGSEHTQAPRVRHVDRPSGDRRARDRLRDGKFSADRKITHAETAAFPRARHLRTRSRPAPDTRRSGWQRAGAGRSPARGHVRAPTTSSGPARRPPARRRGVAAVAQGASSRSTAARSGDGPHDLAAKVFNGARCRDRRGRPGHARWPGRPDDPVPEHVRPARLDHRPLPGQPPPVLAVQRLVFTNGKSSGPRRWTAAARSSSAAAARVIDSRSTATRCNPTGPDIGGTAIQVFSRYHGLPVYVVRSTFGGPAASATVLDGGAI